MTDFASPEDYGVLTEPSTLKIQRLLPGPIERVWAYLTESDLRRKWLAAGEMEMTVGAPFELVWRNDELTQPPGQRPPDFGPEHHMQSRITELEPRGNLVQLTLIHRRLPDRGTMLMVGAGWHMHLDILVARASGKEPTPFWDGWARLRQDYDRRLPT